jgi:hypothetical protein
MDLECLGVLEKKNDKIMASEINIIHLLINSFIHSFQNPTDPGTGRINHWI